MGGKAGTAVRRKTAATGGARAMWKGELGVGEDVVPVKLYSAVEDQRIHFRLLHEKDLAPVTQRMEDAGGQSGPEVDAESQEPGESSRGGDGAATIEVLEVAETRRAFPLDDGTLVMLSKEELAGIAPEKSRSIEIIALVPPAELGHLWYDRPYFLGPDGDEEDAYCALVEALARTERVAVVRWAMRNKRYVGAILPQDGRLVLCTLRHADEIVAMPRVEPGARAAPTAKEQKLAEQLVEMLVGDFEPEVYQDEYRNRVLEFVEARARGETVLLEPPVEKAAAGDALEEALAASLGTGGNGKGNGKDRDKNKAGKRPHRARTPSRRGKEAAHA